MRLDKFLKVSRLVKRRSIAKEFADSERILVNGRVAKPATEVKKGDVITIGMGGRSLTVEVVDLRENVRAPEGASLYRVIREDEGQS